MVVVQTYQSRVFNQAFSLSFAESSGEAAEVKIRSFEIICFFLVFYGAKFVRSFHGFQGGDVLICLLDGHRFFTVHRLDGGTVELEWFVNHDSKLSGFTPPPKEGACLPLEKVDLSSAPCLGHFP